jgi:hypothetical protein
VRAGIPKRRRFQTCATTQQIMRWRCTVDPDVCKVFFFVAFSNCAQCCTAPMQEKTTLPFAWVLPFSCLFFCHHAGDLWGCSSHVCECGRVHLCVCTWGEVRQQVTYIDCLIVMRSNTQETTKKKNACLLLRIGWASRMCIQG